MEKLKTNTIAVIRLYSGNPMWSNILRCFVKSYNVDERRYVVICLTNPAGSKVGKTMLVTDKSIIAVEEQLPAAPDLRKWDVADALGFCTYEFGILCTAAGKLPPSDAWDVYATAFKLFQRNPNRERLNAFLIARTEHSKARSMPFHGTSKSRVVARRLRKKETMRNSNSRMSTKRSRATYYTPSQLVEGQLSNKPPKRKPKKKKKKKVVEAEAVPVGITSGELLSVSFYGSPLSEDISSYGYSLAPGIGSGRVTAASHTKASGKKSRKNLEDDIPF